MTNDSTQYALFLDEFKFFIEEYRSRLSPNSHNIGFVYYRLSRLNFFLLTNSYQEGYVYLKEVKEIISSRKYAADAHRKVLFYYKLAAFAFALGKYDEALEYLAELLNSRDAILRSELELSARLLQLMCFYKNDNFSVMDYALISLSRSMGKINDRPRGQRSVLELLKKLHKIEPINKKELLKKELAYFQKLEKQAIEKKSFKYLDIISWIKAELARKTIAEIN